MSTEDGNKRIASEAAEVARQASDWLKAAKDVNDAIPFVKQALSASEQLHALYSKAPVTFDYGNSDAVYSNIYEARQLFNSPNFKLPVSVFQTAISGSAGVTSATNIAYVTLGRAVSGGDYATQAWANEQLLPIQKLQTVESNVAFIRRKLAALRAGSELEFDQSVSDYHKCVAQTMPATAAGASMRNVMESLNGNLLALARLYDPSAHVRRWDDIPAIVARGAPGSAQVSQLLSQKIVYSDLHDKKLTPILKNDAIPSTADWESLYSEYVGFLYAVLGLVDFRDGT